MRIRQGIIKKATGMAPAVRFPTTPRRRWAPPRRRSATTPASPSSGPPRSSPSWRICSTSQYFYNTLSLSLSGCIYVGGVCVCVFLGLYLLNCEFSLVILCDIRICVQLLFCPHFFPGFLFKINICNDCFLAYGKESAN